VAAHCPRVDFNEEQGATEGRHECRRRHCPHPLGRVGLSKGRCIWLQELPTTHDVGSSHNLNLPPQRVRDIASIRFSNGCHLVQGKQNSN